jgi:hypothetical protein
MQLDAIAKSVNASRDAQGAILPGLGRIISKLDPMYGIHEDDKQDASEGIGKEVIKRLHAEDQARRYQEGKV